MRLLLLRWLAGAAIVLTLAIGTATAAIPGPQRALCPQCFGLTDIGGDVFTDDPTLATQLLALVAAADAEMTAFFGGPPLSHPRYILCTRPPCLTIPVLVMDGGASPDWIRNTASTLADALPNARHASLPDQAHSAAPEVLAPELERFFLG